MLNRILVIIFLFLSQVGLAMDREKVSKELLEKQEFDLVIQWLKPYIERGDYQPSDYSHLIYAYYAKGELFNALAYSNKWLKISLEESDTINLLKASRYKTSILYNLQDLEGSIASAEFSLKYYRPTDTIGLTLTQINIGLFQCEKGDYELAYNTYHKLAYENVVLADAESDYFNNFGIIYIKNGLLDSGIYCFKQSIVYKAEAGDLNSVAITYSNIASAYLDLQNYDLAIAYLDSASSISLDKLDHVFELIYENYFVAYNEMGMPDSALIYVHKLKELNHSLFLDKMDLEMKELEDQYYREFNLKTKIIQSDQKLEESKLQLLLSIIIILLIVVIAGAIILLLRYRNLKTSRNNLLTTQQLLRSQITPHFLYNSLSTIQGMILKEENKLAANYLSKFSRLVRLILKNSRDKVVSLSDELEAINYYLDLQNARFSEMFEYSIRLEPGVEGDHVYIPPMLIQPFVENSIEHGFKSINWKGILDLHIYFENKTLICKITDNGIGSDSVVPESIMPKKESMSTEITMERMRLLAKEFNTEASLEVVDRKNFNEQGTIVTIAIPYKYD